jgi:hypothetical protein
MNRCLEDKALLEVHDAAATSAERTHLSECKSCASRYRQLTDDLEAITQILRGEPPPNVVADGLRPFTVRWLPAGAALAMALLLVWIGVRLWNPSARPLLEQTNSSDTGSILDEFRANPLLLSEALTVELAIGAVGSYDLAATILEAERPCEWYDVPIAGTAESGIEDLEFSENGRPAACIETKQDDGQPLQKPKVRKNIS